MEYLAELWLQTFDEWQVYGLDVWLDDWAFKASILLFLVEILRLAMQGQMRLNILGDAITNFITLAFITGIIIIVGALYIGTFYYVYAFRLIDIPSNLFTMILLIILADFAYYWEHRFTHRCGIFWATHTVHHSSPYFNISVAYRAGPLDTIVPIFFHIPLVLIGFNPISLLFAEAAVLLYQTFLHTEAVGKLPRPIEAVMNTPSHHRVHHGANTQYIDKNYGGIFIIWDRMFQTFAVEDEKVIYGVVPPLKSNNPFWVFFHGLVKLGTQINHAKGLKTKFAYLYKPPEWDGK